MSERYIIVMEVIVPDLDLGEAPWSKLRTGEAEIQMCQSWRIDAPATKGQEMERKP
jgi:hypothetical protein